MPLVDIQLHLLVGLVELAGLAPGAQHPNGLFKNLHGLEAILPFVSLDVELDSAIGRYGDFKFALWHKVIRTRVFISLVCS